MVTKKNAPKKNLKHPELHAIRVGTFKPSLSTISSLDCGIDLSSYAYSGLKYWK